MAAAYLEKPGKAEKRAMDNSGDCPNCLEHIGTMTAAIAAHRCQNKLAINNAESEDWFSWACTCKKCDPKGDYLKRKLIVNNPEGCKNDKTR